MFLVGSMCGRVATRLLEACEIFLGRTIERTATTNNHFATITYLQCSEAECGCCNFSLQRPDRFFCPVLTSARRSISSGILHAIDTISSTRRRSSSPTASDLRISIASKLARNSSMQCDRWLHCASSLDHIPFCIC